MKNLIYKTGVLAFFASALLTSCDPEIDTPSSSSGTADFSSYVAVGNSLSAGYADNGLTRPGQEASLPAILARQFEKAGGGEFEQPLFSEEQANGSGYLRLAGFTPQGQPITQRVKTGLAVRGQNEKGDTLYTKYTENINNLAIPGIKAADIKTVGYGSTQGNPYFERLTNNPSQTYLQYVQEQAQAANHTFFSVWIAENDVLGYATSGGAFESDNRYKITPVADFDAKFTELLNVLTADSQKGVLMTVPDVTSVPFFTTLGASVKQLLEANSIPGMVALTGSGRDRIPFTAAQIGAAENGIYFPLTASSYATLVGQPTGKYWRDLAKQLSPSQDPLVVRLTLAGVLANYAIDTTALFGLSAGNPLPSALVLDPTEQAKIKAATDGYNQIIKAQATARDLALFDANAYFKSIKAGFAANNVAYSPAFISGNLFSLDGIHPTPRGYAVVANEVIDVINAKYNANVPKADITQYNTVLFPGGQ
ncbi:SGNH/GDSL hydrolase family protein [Pontibacter korlensis]|uniref:SGNH/GDSL hydrolase family protein n=1 Tax=Pontibacter korlensis TaxID=400092 RepID=UPI00061AE505|nr:SGNH/GDSL hydrolase family protein [Pontibacter korlensis]